MIPVSHNYWQAAQEGRQEVVLSLITTPRGRYLQSNVWPSATVREYFGGVAFWDGSRTLGDGGTWSATPLSDFGNRLLNPGSLKETLAPIHGNLPVSLGQTERGAVTVEYDNRDRYFCTLFGDQRNEPFLLQEHVLYHGFLGLDPADFLKVFAGWITQLRYSARRAILVSEAQATTYPSVEIGTAITTYVLYMEFVP